jgi:hypothetical protein
VTDQKKKQIQSASQQSVMESLKSLGGGAASDLTDLFKGTSEDFFSELIGLPKAQKKVSGEIGRGESLQVSEAMSGKSEENRKLKAQISLERNLSADEKRLSEQKLGELRVHLQALTHEISKLAATTQGLAKETQVAVMEAPANPGIYHVIFFEKLITFMQSFRKKIEQSSVWLQSSNKRAQKKDYWSMYKKKGSSFLLAPDHYLQRSAG